MQAQKLNNGEVTIAVLCGGSFQAIAENLDMVGAQIGVAFDVPNELRNEVELDGRIIPVALAEGQSVGSILERFERDDRYTQACQILRYRPGDLHQGLAQTPALGAMAFDDYADMGSVIAQILSRVKQLTNAAPSRIQMYVFGSNSGGTGRGTLLKATKALAKALHDRTDAVINVLQVRLGAQTFNGLGGHVQGNNAVGLMEDLAYVLDVKHGQREVRGFVGLELPLVGGDKARRDRYVRIVTQALMAPEARTALERRDVNLAIELTNPYGRFSTVQVGVWELPESVNRAASAASHLLPQIEVMLVSSGDAGTAKINVMVNVHVTKGSNVDGLLGLVVRKADLPGDHWDQFVRSEVTVETAVYVTPPTKDDALPLAHSVALGMPKTLAQFTEGRQLLMSIRSAVEVKLEATRIDEAKTRVGLLHTAKRLEGVLGVLFPRNLVQKGQAAIANRQKEAARMKALATAHSRQEIALAEKTAVRSALEDALQQVKQATGEYETFIVSVADWLREETAQEGAFHGLFTYVPFEDVFQPLVHARQTGSKHRFESVVTSAISGVTRQGLVTIMGLKDDAFLQIAQVLTGNAPVITPPWGGMRRRESPREVIVLPPVSKDVTDQIVMALTELGAETQVVQGSTVAGGVAVVKLHVFSVSQIGHVATRQYAAEYDATQQTQLYVLAAVPGNPGKSELVKIVATLESQQNGKPKKGGKK